MNAERMGDGPIIYPGMDARMGDNINGPSLIRVPDWVEQPLGRYYLYFAHHDGHYIRLAYADALPGPWHVHEPGVLPLASSGFVGHVASPDVHVDHDQRRIRMYFHGADFPTGQPGPQLTRVALSADGLDFVAQEAILGTSYFRVFHWDGWHYALVMPGQLSRSKSGLHDFEQGPRLFDEHMRHCALLLEGDRLRVFYSRVGDSPERILLSEIQLAGDWHQWRESEPVEVLAPETDYEGVHLPLVPSVRGISRDRVRELRDPAVYVEGGERFLLYSVAGESGIGLARLAEK